MWLVPPILCIASQQTMKSQPDRGNPGLDKQCKPKWQHICNYCGKWITQEMPVHNPTHSPKFNYHCEWRHQLFERLVQELTLKFTLVRCDSGGIMRPYWKNARKFWICRFCQRETLLQCLLVLRLVRQPIKFGHLSVKPARDSVWRIWGTRLHASAMEYIEWNAPSNWPFGSKHANRFVKSSTLNGNATILRRRNLGILFLILVSAAISERRNILIFRWCPQKDPELGSDVSAVRIP